VPVHTQYSVQIRDCNIGKNVTIVEPVNLYECTIGDNTKIGPFVEIQQGVIIGNNCNIQSHSFICTKVSIGNNCFIGHGVMFINDLFKNGKPDPNSDNWKETIITNNVTIGSGVTLLPIVISATDVVIGAGSVVTKDITKSGIYFGNPAKFYRDHR
jgi:acetyltransferase-like isoleucine patch superfamily enzyme